MIEMNEEFLQYVWKFQLFNHYNLRTSSEETVQIIHPGIQNFDSGPDFFNAKIKIGDTVWAGNVEIHIKSSYWNTHKHQFDAAYNNVILHVVYEDDKITYSFDDRELPVLAINEHMDSILEKNYIELINNQNWIPCSNQINEVKDIYIKNWLSKVLVGRLENKAIAIEEHLIANKNNWEEVFYQFLAKGFGFKINAQPFLMLAYALPIKYLHKHSDNLFQIEALLFGQAGLLNRDFVDEYPRALKKEYSFLRNKYRLESIESHLWKFFRIRPSNFPTVRIAQFSSLLFHSKTLFSLLLSQKDKNQMNQIFDVTASSYWTTHYDFDKLSTKREKRFGKSSLDNLLINTVVPFFFVYGNKKQIFEYKERALYFLEQISNC